MRESEIMVIGGQAAGKTTFTAGLIEYLETSREHDGSHRLVYGKEEEFREVIDAIRQQYRFLDKQTLSAYIVRFTLSGGLFAPENQFDIMDLPGEQQEKLLESRILTDGDWTESQVVNEYDDGVREKIESDDTMYKSDWRKAFLYRYVRSNQVVFLCNLHKFLHRDDLDLKIHPSEMVEVAREKTGCALVFTACDEIGYDPESFEGNPGFFDQSVFDEDLYDQLHDQLGGVSGSGQVLRLAKQAKNSQHIDMFGVAVPESDGEIERGPDGINLRGFGRVIEWLE